MVDAGNIVRANGTARQTSPSVSELIPIDIEHVPVLNDPRAWSPFRKNVSLALIASASMIAGLAGNIQNPAVEEMEADLPATSSQFSLSISVFILIQGLMPLLWSAISELKGRKLVYLVSLSLFTLGSIVSAVSNSIELIIGFRSLQAVGSSAVISIGAATLADIFEPAERGTKMGIYYIAPLLGPALGPIFGGVLTTGFNWRAIFWFLAMVAGPICLLFLFFFNDTFRRERSLAYQSVLKRKLRENGAALRKSTKDDVEAQACVPSSKANDVSAEKHDSAGSSADDVKQATTPVVTLSLKDLSPFKPLGLVLRRWNNVAILVSSGFLFAFGYLITYTSARTLSSKYHYSALKIGLVLLAYGLGCVAGSLLGGRWSDHELARLKAANGDRSYPEMRLKSAIYSIFLLPPCVLGFGWVCEQRVHVSAICVMLFTCGFFSIWTYASALAYLVDANNGRSSSAFATNSAFRGISAFLAIEVAVPLQDGIGDGWMYTLWAGLMLASGMLILLVSWRGQRWRKRAEIREGLQAGKVEASTTSIDK